MRILLLSAPFEFYQGGSELQYTQIDKYLTSMGDEVKFLFRYPTTVHDPEKYITYNYKIRKNYSRYCMTDAMQIYKRIKQIDPDIIYKRGVNYISAIGIAYSKQKKVSYIQHIASSRDVEMHRVKGNIKQRIYNCIDLGIEKFVIRESSSIVAQAHYQDDLLQTNYQRKADCIIPNSLPIPEQLRTESPLKYVIWVGNLKPVKRPELFIRLAESLQDTDIQFLMIGRDPLNDWSRIITERISRLEKLSYLGECTLDRVNQMISESCLFVNTSEYEGFPNTYIQAFMRGVPVATLKIDPDGVIKKHGMGFVSKTEEQLRSDVLKVMNSRNLRESMGLAARKYAFTNHGKNNLFQLRELFRFEARTGRAES